jgi:hypothetical protein
VIERPGSLCRSKEYPRLEVSRKSMEKPFTIASFAWNKQIADNLRLAGCDAEDEAEITASLVALCTFLESHRLATRRLLDNGELIGGREFALRSSDLTDQGLAVIRAGFGAWESKGCPATDLRPLERAYKNSIRPRGKA